MGAGMTRLLAPSEAEGWSLYLGLAGELAVLEGPWVNQQEAVVQ